MATEFRIWGIRHHGVGSARSVLRALEAWQPDALLIEGAPEADKVLKWASSPELKLPIALLVYQKEEPGRCAFFPFAAFSPEWQALRWALKKEVSVRMIDLPQTHWQALRAEETAGEQSIRQNPFTELARAYGYTDSELWWEQFIEYRHTSEEVFPAILALMQDLREAYPETDIFTLRREAAMRKAMRKAKKEGFQRIAVVCGAWHAPALVPEDFPTQKEDNALLKGLPKVKVAVSWSPWSYERLSKYGGYGAGVQSPAWYEMLWHEGKDAPSYWMAQVATLLRQEKLDASTAQVIEGVRLAETLARLRGRTLPGLEDLLEAATTVFTEGEKAPQKLIEKALVIGDRLGEVPPDTPLTPLQQDFKRLTRTLRLKPSAQKKNVEFDLRKTLHLNKSRFLHRLNLLNINWGRIRRIGTANSSSFQEVWALDWKHEFDVDLIIANNWGNTIEQASTAFALNESQQKTSIADLSAYLTQVILADLPQVTRHLAQRIESESVEQTEIWLLMDVLFPLATTLSYNNLRQTDTETLHEVTRIILHRIFVGLPEACAHLEDEYAQTNYARFKQFYQTLIRLPEEVLQADWTALLLRIAEYPDTHGLFVGRTQRMYLDQQTEITRQPQVAAQWVNNALSTGSEPKYAAAWLEGFLDGGGSLLRFQTHLWSLLDSWLKALPEMRFIEILPALRRTFSQFSSLERQRLWQMAEVEKPKPKFVSRLRYNPEHTQEVESFVERIFD